MMCEDCKRRYFLIGLLFCIQWLFLGGVVVYVFCSSFF